MEIGTIEREIYIEAPVQVVFDVVSSPEHLTQWWPDEARFEREPGAAGEIVFGEGLTGTPGGKAEQFTVVDVEPPTSFSFRWTHPAGEAARPGNSLLVTFTLTPSGTGTSLRMTETGFRELGFEAARLDAMYQDHTSGWDYFIPRIAPYAEKLAAQ